MTYRARQRLLVAFTAVLVVGVLGSIGWMVWYDTHWGRAAPTISADTHKLDLGLSSRDLAADMSRAHRTVQRDGTLGLCLARFQLRAKHYPARIENLLEATDGGQPIVATPQVLNDPWNQMYHYRNPGVHNTQSYDLWSLGPDGKDGTEDDITNW